MVQLIATSQPVIKPENENGAVTVTFVRPAGRMTGAAEKLNSPMYWTPLNVVPLIVAVPCPRLEPDRRLFRLVGVPLGHGAQFGVFPWSPPVELTEKFKPVRE